MKILYITFDDLSQNFAWTIHITEIIQELTSQGHKITLMLPSVEKPSKIDCELVFFKPRDLNIFNFLSVANKIRPDFIYIRGIHISLKPLLVKVFSGIPLVIEINGLIEYVVANGLLGNLFKAFVPIYLRSSNGVITVSNLFKKALRKKGARNVYVVSNGVSKDKFKPIDKNVARKNLGLNYGKIGCFIGSFYPHHYLELLVEAVRQTKPNITFLMVGDGPRKAFIENLCRDMPNFIFKGQVPHELIPTYIASSDFGILILKRMYKYYSPSPIKLYEYMACGRPVALATDIGELVDLVVEKKCGLACDLNSVSLGRIMVDLCDYTEEYSANTVIASQDFTWEKSAKKLEEALCRISSR